MIIIDYILIIIVQIFIYNQYFILVNLNFLRK